MSRSLRVAPVRSAARLWGSVGLRDRLVAQRPVQHLCVRRLRKPPPALRYEPSDISSELAAVEIPYRARLQHRVNGERALDAAVRPFGVAVVEVGPHDPERQVPLDRLVEGRTPEPGAQRLLSGKEKGTSQERTDRCPGDREAGGVPD